MSHLLPMCDAILRAIAAARITVLDQTHPSPPYPPWVGSGHSIVSRRRSISRIHIATDCALRANTGRVVTDYSSGVRVDCARISVLLQLKQSQIGLPKPTCTSHLMMLLRVTQQNCTLTFLPPVLAEPRRDLWPRRGQAVLVGTCFDAWIKRARGDQIGIARVRLTIADFRYAKTVA